MGGIVPHLYNQLDYWDHTSIHFSCIPLSLLMHLLQSSPILKYDEDPFTESSYQEGGCSRFPSSMGWLIIITI